MLTAALEADPSNQANRLLDRWRGWIDLAR